MASTSALTAPPRSETSTATARSDRVRRSINCDIARFVSLAGDLDLVVGEWYGSLIYIENIGTSTAPVFVARTGSANPLDGIDVGVASAPALGDLDGDGTRKPRPSTDKLQPHALCLAQATWTS